MFALFEQVKCNHNVHMSDSIVSSGCMLPNASVRWIVANRRSYFPYWASTFVFRVASPSNFAQKAQICTDLIIKESQI